MSYQFIDREECIGDSLVKINANAADFDTRLNTLSSRQTSLNVALTGATVFVPVNYNITSGQPNQNVIIANYSVNGTRTTGLWESGDQTVNLNTLGINTPPLNTRMALLHVYFNSNPNGNNALSFWVRRNTLEDYHQKIQMDPTGNRRYTFFEAESDVTFPVYFDTAFNNFQWKIQNNRTELPTAVPQYYVKIYLLGYYVSVPLIS